MARRLVYADVRSLDATRVGAWLHPGDAEALVVCAPIVGEAIALGAFQRAKSTLDVRALEGSGTTLVRRASGGPAVRIGRGRVHVALHLRSPDALGGVSDPGRALNRHVRPLLRALTSLGDVTATSGGRDVILMGGEPVAWVGVAHERRTGRTVVEAIVNVSASFALDDALDLAHGAIAPRWLGKPVRTIDQVLGRSVEPALVVEAILRELAITAEGQIDRIELPALPRSRVDLDQAPFTAMVEEVVGLLGAVVERDRVALGGDLYASTDALEALGAELFALGPDVDDARLSAAVDAAFAEGTLLLGVQHRGSIGKVVRGAWQAQKSDARGR
ncbi:MAG: hypothetical protein HYV09_09660 [Deltaproteobacteria bacterium]|nr:hypothetical protein [Deltaproteobacteria bacterium]